MTATRGWTLAVTSEGYTADQQGLFDQHAQEFRTRLLQIAPFNRSGVGRNVTVTAFFEPSGQEGLGTGSSAVASSAYGISVDQNGGLVGSWDQDTLATRSRNEVPGRDAALVLINHTGGSGFASGGQGQAIALRDSHAHTVSRLQSQVADRQNELDALEGRTEPDEMRARRRAQVRRDAAAHALATGIEVITSPYRVALHELGHLFGLADEYDGEPGSQWPPFRNWVGERGAPNAVRTIPAFGSVSWSNQFDHPGDDALVWSNSECAESKVDQDLHYPSDLSPLLSADHVGLIEGTRTRNCSRWKPSADCLMNKAPDPFRAAPTPANNRFCRVCATAIEGRINETSG